jgi:succinate dehydrogenase / fumarate reductase flavoprotein subunit
MVPGLFAVGEAACVSVHGANRLGSNSLIDLVVFGRAAGHRLEGTDQAGHRARAELPKDSADSRSDASITSATPSGASSPDGRSARREMQRTMQANAAVFRTDEVLVEGKAKLDPVYARMQRHRRQPTARLIWNTDLIETLELDNLISQASVTLHGRRTEPQGKPRRARPRGLSRSRRRRTG